MNKSGLGAMLGGILLAGPALAGVDIEVTNQSVSDIAFAFSYLDQSTKRWVAEGWYNVSPRTKSVITLKTDNSLVYIYGEVSNGTKIEGGRGNVELGVNWKSFRYEQDKGLESPDLRAQFMRAIAIDSKVSLNIK